ncbi:exodeoxyribonuclease X C-terminal domain-containing protein [Flavobacterium aurantiibacter]|uniref:Exodeoxyribonuclease X-like C-terminal domain-containing protein n=1 Tax=Flavobacterium aurantiibacter TaxID=2023067 RepID=A0A256AA96_9FLAO|nr:hypothetical protein [Flavobacterium aurantiibacter]OYQ50608.1 hypothetical protein CHX27_00810 [Flavobacterium aurantiibacter]
MRFYTLDTEFTFGKYEGKTMKEILEIQPTYLDWCAINLDHFYISDEIIAEIKVIKPDFTITEEGKQKLADKYSTWENEQQGDDYDDYDDYSPSYEKYGGAYGYDDDTIDNAFEGDPENYWNID